MRLPADPGPPEPAQVAAVAVVRAWIEGDPPSDLRVKITTAPLTTGGDPSDLGTTASIPDACAVLGEWLERFATTNQPRPRLGVVHPGDGGRRR